ncbi:type I secretion system permease/ATPase [Alisedimentitalea sp. MJ-SS2]|uniref:type I secretion system permease/ATPase n=1 Tax=Aliisedimentitalea sp. MJ-SS2 TaxID=3049795 RepID=UPI002908E53C|nr:type I secretion system permease/ATPase [Alisedimentitalea sp. MJ-SS2]MDU8927616.1 type I secretion system permease/ATPase [Alisedimentitalea sp. MJ-SS2]
MRRNSPPIETGLAELRDARRQSRGLYWAVGLFGVFVNLLMLTGPLYMLQVYDRVLGSRSVATLVALSILVLFLYLMYGLLDFARGRVMARAGARFQARLDGRVFDAVLRKSSLVGPQETASNLADLEAVQRLMSSPALLAVTDIPWTPFFLFAIFIFHPWLGTLAILGGAALILLAVINQWVSRAPLNRAGTAGIQADRMAGNLREEAELVVSLGMRDAAFRRWETGRKDALAAQVHATDLSSSFTSVSKSFRLLLQSAMLGLGAYLVLQGQLTPGAMIAGSILLGRALQPVEQTIAQWALIERARRGWHGLAVLLSEVPPEAPRTALPRPRARLDVQQLTIVPPGQSTASLRMLSFKLEPGTALGVIGPSGAGKSTLAHALTGVWRPAGGYIRLDGAALDQYDPNVLGGYVGYLPQRVQLFDGTIAENIARLSPAPDDAKVVEAAQKADAHDMILGMPRGYDTQVSAAGGRLSGGQIQRIGLARAMYDNPVLLVLDEPNSNLDNTGSIALNKAIRAMKAKGGSVIIMAHRPAAIQECELLLVLEGGARKAFGPRDEVLRETVQNAAQIAAARKPGGIQ